MNLFSPLWHGGSENENAARYQMSMGIPVFRRIFYEESAGDFDTGEMTDSEVDGLVAFWGPPDDRAYREAEAEEVAEILRRVRGSCM